MQKFTLVLVTFLILASFSSIDAKKHRKNHKQTDEQENAIEQTNTNDQATAKGNPCATHHCGAGKECVIDSQNGEAKCQCVSKCAENTDVRRRVCSNHNSTWQSDCHLHRHRCLCVEALSEDCTEDHKHMHIDYYGECQQLEECRKEVLEDFPRRMREWLYTIMSTKRPSVKEGEDPDSHLSRKWVDAVIWKWCDLDKHPHDRHVSRHELFPLRAPLLAMESCISDFLDGCDKNDDHKITLIEWGECLGASDSELEDKCTLFKSLVEEQH